MHAHLFKAGEYPFTKFEFYNVSSPALRPNPGPDIIIMKVFEGEGDRIADATSSWWTSDFDYVWSAWPLPLDENHKLTENVVRFYFDPLTLGSYNTDHEYHMPAEGLISYTVRNDSAITVFGDIQSLMHIFNKYIGEGDQLSILTVWECSAGAEYIPGEPDEYEENYYLIGVAIPDMGVGLRYDKIQW